MVKNLIWMYNPPPSSTMVDVHVPFEMLVINLIRTFSPMPLVNYKSNTMCKSVAWFLDGETAQWSCTL